MHPGVHSPGTGRLVRGPQWVTKKIYGLESLYEQRCLSVGRRMKSPLFGGKEAVLFPCPTYAGKIHLWGSVGSSELSPKTRSHIFGICGGQGRFCGLMT